MNSINLINKENLSSIIKFIDDKEPCELKKIESKIALGSLGKFFRNNELDFKKNFNQYNLIR